MKAWVVPLAVFASSCFAQLPSVSNATGPSTKPGLYIIAGMVVSEASGEPLADAHLILTANRDRSERVTVISDAGGHFSFANVLAGKYNLDARRRGFVPQALDQHDVFSTAIVVGPKLDAEHVVFRMKPAGSISGYVLDEDNEPVGGAQVWLFMRSVSMGVASHHVGVSNVANDKGRFRFSSLMPGTYFLAVTAQPWYAQGQQRSMARFNSTGQTQPALEPGPSPFDVAYPLTYYNGAADFASATPVTLSLGSSATANITLRAVPAVHLRIVEAPDEGGRPRNIQLFHEGPGGTRMYVSTSQYNDGTGTYIGGLAPGHYEAEIQHFDPKDGKMLEQGMQAIDATGDGTLDPHPSATGSLSAKIISDTPLSPGQQLFIQLRTGLTFNLMSTPVLADGTVIFPNAVPRAGRYEVFLLGQPDLSVQSVTATGAKASGRVVELTGSGAVELTIAVTGGRQAEVSGFVMQDDKAVAGAMVLLIPEDNRMLTPFIPRDQSDTDGTFSVPQVPPGKYLAIAIDDGVDLEYTNPEMIRPYMAAAQPVVAHPGATVKIQLVAQARVK